jgi:membrane-bound serine protease (ClpP class)
MANLTALFEAFGPNLVYLAAIAALWLAITAVYVPGTGLLELGALVSFALALGGMLSLPTNVVGVALLAASMGCFLALLFYHGSFTLALAGLGLVFQLLGSFFLFREGVRPDIGIILLVTGAAFAYHQLILLPGLRAQTGISPLEPDRLIGQRAQVEATIDPVGQVRVAGERWSATADQVIGAGETVRVVGRDGLVLRVTPESVSTPVETPLPTRH